MRKFSGSMLACVIAVTGGLVLGIVSAVAQQPAAEGKKAKAPKAPAAQTSPLFFHVEFKQPATPGERPITPADVAAINAVAPQGAAAGLRYPEHMMARVNQ